MNVDKSSEISNNTNTSTNRISKSYKFETNLLKVSKSKDIEEAKREWCEIYTEHREIKTGLCICQHTLKNIKYMYNVSTKQTISVGTGCCQKFNLDINTLTNDILKSTLQKLIEKGEYKIINDIFEYTKDVQIQLINNIKIKYEKCPFNYDSLTDLKKNVKNLIDEYDLQYLQEVYNDIDNLITEHLALNEHKRIEDENIRIVNENSRIERDNIRKEQLALNERKRVEDENIRIVNKKARIECENKTRLIEPIKHKVIMTKEEQHLEISNYINSLTDQEKQTLEIAKSHLGTSFNIMKSIGFLSWKANK